MNYKEVLEAARGNIGPVCKACPVCNGKACGATIPGPGSRNAQAVLNWEAWQKLRLNMDTLCAGDTVDMSFEFAGKTFKIPVFAGPVGAMKMHYGEKHTDISYNNVLVAGCAQAGIAAMTGDGVNGGMMEAASVVIKANNGLGIPTVKPWHKDTVAQRMELVKASNAFAVAMDVDGAGLPFLKHCTPPAGPKSVAELKEIIDAAGVPFIVKGVMTVKGALKAVEAGAYAIVVSNHGGRVLDDCMPTAVVLPAIAKACKGKVKILVDGGIRTGADIFKAIALGADGVIIARPFVVAAYGGDEAGMKVLVDKLAGELEDAMLMCGARSLTEISEDMVSKL